MIQDIKPYLEQIKGNTWCIVTGYARIPMYKLDDHRVVLIDSGIKQDGEGIAAVFQENDLQPVAVLTSHTHPDHAGNHAMLQKMGAKLYMTPFAAATMADPMTMYAVLGTKAGYHKTLERMGGTVQTDCMLPWEDTEVTVEGAVFRQFTTPGHCAEQLCFITPDNVAYMADAILSPRIISTVRLPYCSCLEPYIQSLHKLETLDCDQYILAHNGVEPDIRAVVKVTLEEIHKRLDALESLADTPVTFDELVRKFLIQTKADLTSWRSVNGVGFNAKTFLGYLVDHKRLKFVLDDGIMKYVQTAYKEDK